MRLMGFRKGSLLTSLPFPCSENQRAQKVFKATPPMDLQAARNKLMGFGMQLLDSIDPNPDNMVCAGIVHTQSQQVGCLLRLEPNKQAQVSTIVRDGVDLTKELVEQ